MAVGVAYVFIVSFMQFVIRLSGLPFGVCRISLRLLVLALLQAGVLSAL